jgi:hypothetical protein
LGRDHAWSEESLWGGGSDPTKRLRLLSVVATLLALMWVARVT